MIGKASDLLDTSTLCKAAIAIIAWFGTMCVISLLL